jgi:hypothetical protein
MQDSTERIAVEILDGRLKEHAKLGANSMESIPPFSHMWLAILGEEFGEAAHELTYDAGRAEGDREAPTAQEVVARRKARLRAELVDVATVTVAWIASLDRG